MEAENIHAKLSCAPPSQYKATLCTIKVHVGTELVNHGAQCRSVVHNVVVGQWCTM